MCEGRMVNPILLVSLPRALLEIEDFFIAAVPVTQSFLTQVLGADSNPSVNRGPTLPVENVS